MHLVQRPAEGALPILQHSWKKLEKLFVATTFLKLQAMTFMTSVHYGYHCAHGKGKYNPKNIGERPKSTEEPAEGHHKKVPGARGRADTIQVTHSR